MNAPAQLRPLPYNTKLFAAFRLHELPCQPFDNGSRSRTSPIAIHGATSLDEAVNAAIYTLSHKEKLLIRETDEESGKTTLHLFAVKKRARADFVRVGDRVERRERLYCERLCEIEGGILHG
jgi:hypothetical protein